MDTSHENTANDQRKVNREQTNVNESEANRSHSSHVLEVKGVGSRVGKVESGSSLDNILRQAQKIKSKAKLSMSKLHFMIALKKMKLRKSLLPQIKHQLLSRNSKQIVMHWKMKLMSV